VTQPSPLHPAPKQDLQTTLRLAGVRVTHARMLVLDVLHDTSQEGVGAADLYRALLRRNHSVSLSTIYAVLNTFKNTRLVHCRREDTSGQQLFALQHH
jgi:Fe2+ or Zn2+ uptake regulation protein